MRIDQFFVPTEKAAGGVGQTGTKSLVQILDEVRADHKVRSSVQWSDKNKLFDGVLKRAPEELIGYAKQFTVGPDQIEEKLAELINFVGELPSHKYIDVVKKTRF